jgi:branched-chain amino acid transport system substrate-binding protein
MDASKKKLTRDLNGAIPAAIVPSIDSKPRASGTDKRGVLLRTTRSIRTCLAMASATVCGAVLLIAPSANAATQASATKSTLVIGAIGTDTGLLGTTTHDMPSTLADWQKYVNKHGGVAGHPVKVIFFDDGADPGKSAADANTLITDDHVVAIIDGTEVDTSWVKTATAANVPVLCGSQSGNGFTCQSTPGFFPSGTTVLASVYGQPWSAKQAGGKKYSIVYCTEEAACAQSVPLEKGDATTVGITFVSGLSASETAPSYTAQCVTLSQSGADAVTAAGPPSAKIADDCAQQGYHPIWIQSMGTWENQYLKDSNLNNSTGVTGNVPWMLKTPALSAFHSAVGNLVNTATSPYTVESTWAAAVLFQTAAAHVGATVTAQDIMNGLYTLNNNTLGGLAPPLTFTSGKATTISCMYVVSIKHGKFVAPKGAKAQCPVPAS